MKSFLILMFFASQLISCKNEIKKKHVKKAIVKTDSVKKDVAKDTNWVDEILNTIPENIKPVFGYRFIIKGDFDGDGNKENLTEHFISRIDYKEINKFYDTSIYYEQLMALTIKKQPYSFVISDDKKIDTLRISSQLQLLGLSFLKNEGDLNGDGTDEVSYVAHWADWSSLNSWHIMTYKNKKWQELYSFSINEWLLPDLPENFNQYGLFGLENKFIITDDTINQKLEKELNNFKGLVKKIKANKIKITYTNLGDVDSMVVDLKRIKSNK